MRRTRFGFLSSSLRQSAKRRPRAKGNTTVLDKGARARASEEPRLRFGTVLDLPAFEEMLRSFLLEQAGAGSPIQVTRRTVDWYRDLAHSYLKGGLFGGLALAEAEGPVGPQPVGFVLWGEDPGVPRLDTDLGRVAVVWLIWVRPEHRKLSTALRLLHFGEPEAVKLGFKTALMNIRTDNTEGQALARAFGARPVEMVLRWGLGGSHDG